MKRAGFVFAFVILAGALLLIGSGVSDLKRQPEIEPFIEISGVKLPRLADGEAPIGTITAFPALSGTERAAPVERWLTEQGWMYCDGRALRKREAPLLFALIGTTYGQGIDHRKGGTLILDKDFNLPFYGGPYREPATDEAGKRAGSKSRRARDSEKERAGPQCWIIKYRNVRHERKTIARLRPARSKNDRTSDERAK